MIEKILFSCLLFFLVLGCPRLIGQNSNMQDSLKRQKHSIGAGAGFTTGYGLAYRYMPSRFGGQINFAPYHNSETDKYSIGITFLYRLIETKTTNLFLYQGNHYYYNSQLVYIYDQPKSVQTDQVASKHWQTESYVNNGFGIGIELIIAKRIGLNLMSGYALYKNFTQVNFTGETALFFKF